MKKYLKYGIIFILITVIISIGFAYYEEKIKGVDVCQFSSELKQFSGPQQQQKFIDFRGTLVTNAQIVEFNHNTPIPRINKTDNSDVFGKYLIIGLCKNVKTETWLFINPEFAKRFRLEERPVGTKLSFVGMPGAYFATPKNGKIIMPIFVHQGGAGPTFRFHSFP